MFYGRNYILSGIFFVFYRAQQCSCLLCTKLQKDWTSKIGDMDEGDAAVFR